MKVAIVACALLFTLLPTADAADADKHQLLGTWSVDVARLSQAPAPKSVTLTLTEAEGGAYRISVDIVAPDGTKQHSAGTFTPGSGPVAVEGSADVDLVTFTMPSRRILVMAGAFQGRPSHTRVWALTDDGKEMSETIVGHIDGKTPHIRTNYWKRQQPES